MKLFDKNLNDEYRNLLDCDRENILGDKFNDKKIEALVNQSNGILYKDRQGTFIDIEYFHPDEPRIFHSYKTHEERLLDEGWERALSIREIFSLFIDSYEEKLNDVQNSMVSQILEGEQEYLSTAIVRDGRHLSICEEPTGLVFDDEADAYVTKRLDWYARESLFTIPDLRHGWSGLSSINKVNDALIDYIFGMKYEKIPENIRRGDERCRIHLPDDNEIWPLIIGVESKYSFGGFDEVALSRGVRVLK